MHRMVFSLLVLIHFSCKDASDLTTKEKNDPLAYNFQRIENNLQEFADKYNAKLYTVWSKIQRQDPSGFDSFLVRQIVWTDDRFGKAIFIGQHSDINSIDTSSWDFSNIAWIQDTDATAKPTYLKDLLIKVDFQVIERDIEQLLRTSEKNLRAIKMEDLK